MVRIDTRGQRFGGRWRLRLVSLATALVFAAAAPAGAAIPTVNRLISPQYQAKPGDTATAIRLAVVVARPAPRAGLHVGSTIWYRPRNVRYQLRGALLHPSHQSSRYVVNRYRAASRSISRDNRLRIAPQIGEGDAVTPERRPISSAEATVLLRLAFGLGLTYVLFLAAWFWRTRNRTEGAVARVVRF